MAHAHMASEVKLYPTKPSSQCRNGVKSSRVKTRSEESEESDLGGRQLG